MRVDYQYYNKTWSYLHYNQFSVGSASEGYPLTFGEFSGVGIDQFAYNYISNMNGVKFTTSDNDNDHNIGGNCAAEYKSGWWYRHCYNININAQPPNGNGGHDNYLFAEIKIHQKHCII